MGESPVIRFHVLSDGPLDQHDFAKALHAVADDIDRNKWAGATVVSGGMALGSSGTTDQVPAHHPRYLTWGLDWDSEE